MNTSIYTYLTFEGNCEEAFNFYKSAFGGEFAYIGRFSEMPPQEGMEFPKELGDKIMHVALPIGNSVLMGSDSCGPQAPKLITGNNFSISVNIDTKEEADQLFGKLSQGGKVIMPMAETFWAAYFGIFTDKFGINWMLNVDNK